MEPKELAAIKKAVTAGVVDGVVDGVFEVADIALSAFVKQATGEGSKDDAAAAVALQEALAAERKLRRGRR